MSPVDINSARLSSDLISDLSSSGNARGKSSPTRHGNERGFEAVEDWCTLDSIFTMGDRDGIQKAVVQEHELGNTESFSQGDIQAESSPSQSISEPNKPFQRWIRTLHKRAARRQGMLGCDGNLSLFKVEGGDTLAIGSTHHRHSSSGSSFGFVTAVKSASVSLAGASLLTRSRINTVQSLRGHSRTDHSSRASVSGARFSEDSYRPDRPAPLDPAVAERAQQRHRILEELIDTEESYIADVRFLMNVGLGICGILVTLTDWQVYVTILASLPTSPACLRPSVNRNLTDIVELHEEILGELRRAVPDPEYTQLDIPIQRAQSNVPVRGHHRWRSLDAVPEGKGGIWLRDIPDISAEPQTAAEVARIFLKKVKKGRPVFLQSGLTNFAAL
jgi:hypothetical protein